jgi:ABC-2 type transport system permease protein
MTHTRIGALAAKEFRHILRDPRSLWIVFMLPNIMMFLFGYAIDLDIKNVRIAVCDLSRTPASRDLVAGLEASSYFTISARYDDPSATARFFEKRQARAAVVVPEDFARSLERESRAEIALIIDGSDANTAALVQNYIETFLATRAVSRGGAPSSPLVSVRPTILYNRTMESTNFIVPGLVAIVMMMLGALLTSIAIVREKETGTMEQILVSPVRAHEVILGKVLPYLALAFVVAMMIVAVGHFHFRVPFAGSPLLLMAALLLYLFTALSLGLLVSTTASTQQTAMMTSLLVTLLPTLMLSGFMFPVASMPTVLRYVSNALPATHFLVIIRGVMLKGNGPAELARHAAALGAIGFVLMILAVKRFSLKLGTRNR